MTVPYTFGNTTAPSLPLSRLDDNFAAVGNSTNVSFTQSGTGASARTVQSKLTEAVSVKDFGAVGDGFTNDTNAFAAASAHVMAQGGGKLFIPPGVYIIGSQTFAGATGLGYSYQAVDVIKINGCSRLVEIEGYGATLKYANNLKFGSFNPVTGNVYNPPTLPFVDGDYRAIIGYAIRLFDNSGGISIRGIEIDGNQAGAILGGQWGDTGRQIAAYGIWTQDNASTLIENVYSHHTCLDGIACGETLASLDDVLKPVTLINCSATYNARNNMTWFGGNGFVAINCKFNYAGRGTFASAPSAGFDPEPDAGVCRNAVFIDCEFSANGGLGFGADSGDTADFNFIGCKFLGTVTYPLKPNKPRIHFSDCIIGGCLFGVYNAPNYIDAARFTRCAFKDDLQVDGVAANFDSWLFEISGLRAVFDDCMFTATTKLMGSSSLARFINCTGVQNGSLGTATIRGEFMGGNNLTFTTGANDYAGSTFYNVNFHTGAIFGASVYNGQQLATSPQFNFGKLFSNDGAAGKIVTIESSYQIPTSGTYVRGSYIRNSLPAVNQPKGWVCIASGTPGTWVSEGNL